MEKTLKDFKKVIFFDEVRRNTEEIVAITENRDDDVIVRWQVVGINFKKDKIIDRYGKEIYNSLCRGYSTKDRKLGHLIHEGVCATKLLDLNLFVKLLAEKGISSYIDFENNTFYFNAKPKKNKMIVKKK